MSPKSDPEQPLNEGQVEWARTELGIASTADEAETRRAFLKVVANDDFAPHSTKLQAYEMLRGDFRDATTAAYHETGRQQTKERVERFAERVFLYTPKERRKEWESLRACSADLPVTWSILNRLQPILDIDFEQLQFQDDSKELAEHLRELFTLPPAKRAERRSSIIEACKTDARRWEKVARSIASRHPNIAALDSPLVEQLSTWSRSEKVMRKPPRVKATPHIKVTKKSWSEDVSQHPWVIVVGLIVLANVGRLVTTSSSNSTSRSTPAYQRLSQPRQGTNDNEDVLRRLKALQSQINASTNENDTPNKIPLLPPSVENQPESADAYQRLLEQYQLRADDDAQITLPPTRPLVAPDDEYKRSIEEAKARLNLPSESDTP